MGIPEASRAVLKEWQKQGLEINVDNAPNIPTRLLWNFMAFPDRYSIPEQPIPENLPLSALESMFELGLKIKGINYLTPIRSINNLRKDLVISEQPIPEGLLQEPVELPLGESALSDMTLSDVGLGEASPTMFTHPAESDPNGLDPHAPGAKLDAGKNRLGLVLGGFARALEEVGKVGTYGAEKYSPNGWKKVEDGSERYEDAMMRHWFARYATSEREHTTGLLHQAQVVWNALAVLENLIKTLEE